jgi:methionyl-tRNA formyltransferase
MIKVWLQAGHRISGVVVYSHRRPRLLEPLQWFALRCVVMRHLRRNSIPVLELSGAPNWQELRRKLAEDHPDVAISYGFMRLLPDNILSAFPAGALNFHPALLPYYRGPKPLAWLAINDDWATRGGVTLHEMTAVFDEGPILAQVPMLNVADRKEVAEFVSDALACMTRDVIPSYCRGEVSVWPQPAGVYPYADRQVPRPVFQRGWTRSQLSSLCKVFVRRPGVTVPISGKSFRLSEEVSDLGPPTGAPPIVSRWTVDFDLADRRVRYRRHSLYSKLRSNLRLARRLFPRPVKDVTIRLGPFDR